MYGTTEIELIARHHRDRAPQRAAARRWTRKAYAQIRTSSRRPGASSP